MAYENYELEEKFQSADKLINEGKISEAAHMLEEILADAPDFGKAHNHMGWLYETKFKNFKQAEEFYKLALKFSPHYPAAYYNYSYLLSTLRRYEDLENLLTSALKVSGINFATIYNEFGLMREIQGRYKEAIDYFRLFIQNSYDSKTIEAAAESIRRCERKMELLVS
jgi:tetratricopeptide (TPR) repeat protein